MKYLTLIIVLLNWNANAQQSHRSMQISSTALAMTSREAASAHLPVRNQTNSEEVHPFTGIFGKHFCLLANRDTIILREVNPLKIPLDCKISPFKIKGINLYCISWIEKRQVQDSTKTEEELVSCSVICDLKKKSPVLSNFETTTNISEIVHLGNTEATETQQRIRREGFVFTLNEDGTVTLQNKWQQSKMVYDEAQGKYVQSD
ncbi:hypothetical protein [Flavobacterium sp. 3HN19-14]|uniref:hypothetical protein n=1 Tax=Flavobacterium sp. 3HN19-14 TaxID=3448133 RepID=UPI003EE32A6F